MYVSGAESKHTREEKNNIQPSNGVSTEWCTIEHHTRIQYANIDDALKV